MKLLSVSSVGADRAVMMTVAPPCWKRSAIALPAPFVPPVTRTRLPLNSSALWVFIRVMIVVEALNCRHRSQAAGRGATDFDFQTGFDLRQPRPFAFVCFLVVLLFRFTTRLS